MDKPISATAAAAAAEAAPLVPYGIPVAAPPNAYILLPLPRRRRRRCDCCRRSTTALLASSSLLLVLSLALFVLWPSDPSLQLARLTLHHVKVVTFPLARLDVSVDILVRVRNPNFFSVNYDSLVTSIAYRGRKLGFVTSAGGRIRARGVSYLGAQLRLDGIRLVSDAIYLIEDVAKGAIPFDTVTEVDGRLRIFAVEIPITGKVSCTVTVDPGNQTIVHQNCYPE